MAAMFLPQTPQVDVPVRHRRPMMPSELADSRLFPGWGPRF